MSWQQGLKVRSDENNKDIIIYNVIFYIIIPTHTQSRHVNKYNIINITDSTLLSEELLYSCIKDQRPGSVLMDQDLTAETVNPALRVQLEM